MPTERIWHKLTDQQLERFSDLFGISLVSVMALNNLGCLNVEYIRETLIREDFEKLRSGLRYMESEQRAYSYKEVKIALAKVYNTTPAEIDAIIKNRKNSSLHFCKRCGQRTPMQTLQRTGGLCSNCMADTLSL